MWLHDLDELSCTLHCVHRRISPFIKSRYGHPLPTHDLSCNSSQRVLLPSDLHHHRHHGNIKRPLQRHGGAVQYDVNQLKKKTNRNMLKTNKRLDHVRLGKVRLELLAEAGTRWDQFHVRRQCISCTWPGNEKALSVTWSRVRETTKLPPILDRRRVRWPVGASARVKFIISGPEITISGPDIIIFYAHWPLRATV